ncbi:MAG: family 16 glycosylhydrolase [Anaerolineales bacterium]|nr:family 16 glycosylhydrolase [Anaerolineales bacterium]
MNARKIAILTLLLLGIVLASAAGRPVTAATLLIDFEGGLPADWFDFAGGGASVNTAALLVADTDPLARPGQVGDNTLLQATFSASTGFAGFGQDFSLSAGSQDWINNTGVSFWMYGTNSGNTYQFEIFDNRSDPNTDTAERFDTLFSDDFTGWQLVTIPFSAFTRAVDYQPPGAPDDGLTLTEMWGWAVPLDGNDGSLVMDDVGLEQPIIDDFESGLPSGTDGDGNPIGFLTFSDGTSTVALATTDTPAEPVPGSVAGNHVLQVDTSVVGGGYAGLVHAFENETVDTWTPQDWSAFSGISFWLYGNNTGRTLFLDVLDNRNPGSTIDDAERFSVDIPDNFAGWQYFELPWEAFHRKEIGNGAPNDGFTLTQVHGWAFGVFSSELTFTNYLDDLTLFGVAEIPELAVTFTANNFNVPEGQTGNIAVKLNRPMNSDDPAQVSVDYTTEPGNLIPGRDFTPANGTLIFTNGGPSELTFPLETLANNKYEGDQRLIVRLANPTDVLPGFITQAAVTIVDDEAFDPNLIDDFERGTYLWQASADATLATQEIAAGDPLALPGQGAYEQVLHVTAPAGDPNPMAQKQQTRSDLARLLPASSPQITRLIKGAVVWIDRSLVAANWQNDFYLNETGGSLVFKSEQSAISSLRQVVNAGAPESAAAQAAIDQLLAADKTLAQVVLSRAVQNNGDARSIDYATSQMAEAHAATLVGNYVRAVGHYRLAWGASVQAVQGLTLAPTTFQRDFAIGQNWGFSDGLEFWYYGQNSGQTITVTLLDNRAPDPGRDGWSLVWSDEFNDPAGTPPNPAHWSYEIGDGTLNGIPGWGNDELQYYTNSTDNVATDGLGNLVLTAREADGSLLCYYGPCDYTSARLLSSYKAEFAYGRIESRILVPDGGDGLWPAFWSLGTDIGEVGWPQTGEIDFMEYVSRIPNEIFGTIHGPGYAGGASFGNTYTFPGAVASDYHTFAIEWQPDLIEWYVDGILYHTATPADVFPNPWVFNDPVFLLLNMAIGGNFGGPVGGDTVFPQSMAVDYVRVYQGPDTAERFESSFVDNFTGWQALSVPFASFTRSATQPAGAPNDGLTLTEVWGYGFRLPNPGTWAGELLLDQVRLAQPSAVTVTNTNNDGEGSLRWAANVVANGGTVTFDPALAGQTILLNGPLTLPAGSITIDAVDAPGIILSGGGSDRVLIVDGGAVATLRHLVIANGYGWQLAGGILNNGNLTLDHVTVTGNTMATDAGDFWQGGGGIYTGDGAALTLIDSTVANNSAAWSGGGIYAFFNSSTTIIRSTISGNVSNDVGGGLRLLSNAQISNSTISGNEATGWYGGALFLTDGVLDMTNTTVTANVSPGFAPAAVFVGTFGPGSATLNLVNSIVAGNANEGCFLAPFGAGAVAINSLGNNVFSDATCFPVGSDQIVASALLGPLANNGGPTWTHALLSGSPAIDMGNNAYCPVVDQRGVPRDAACDVGAYEYVPLIQ